MRTGTATLPLHWGSTPPWLFEKMTKLAREITIAIISEYNSSLMLEKLSNPFWFQSFGCVLGFDWHSSGLTTTVCGAIKEGVRGLENDFGFFVAGGKGRTSRKTPFEIEFYSQKYSFNPKPLVYASKISAKVDNNALQDGYQLYHHNFFFTKTGQWVVVQQGMNTSNRLARRYHWCSQNLENFVNEPHTAICCNRRGREVLNLVAGKSDQNRRVSTEISHEKPEKLIKTLKKLKEEGESVISIHQKGSLLMPRRHSISIGDLNPKALEKTFFKTHKRKAKDFEQLLGTPGVGAKTIRALSLISELIYGAKPSYQDPARYSFAHGGKDGTPYPVDRKTYDSSIMFLHEAIKKAKIGRREKIEAIKRLRLF
jgi:hypothetical protein